MHGSAALTLASVVLAACAAPGSYDQVNQVVQPDHDPLPVELRVIWSDSYADLERRCGLGVEVEGCAKLSLDGSRCWVHVLRPRWPWTHDPDRLEALGHEVAHCIGADHAPPT